MGLPADVATWLANHKREEMLRIERRHGIQVEIVPAAGLLRHESEFEAIARPASNGTRSSPRECRTSVGTFTRGSRSDASMPLKAVGTHSWEHWLEMMFSGRAMAHKHF